MEITSAHIKHALLSYFRYKRGWLCASEFECMDVVALPSGDIHEVEVKISKWDLWAGEAKKKKHRGGFQSWAWAPTRFSLAVPASLIPEAEKFVKETNSNYGIFKYCAFESGPGGWVEIHKTARRIGPKFAGDVSKRVMMRVCSENVGLHRRILGIDRLAAMA